MQDSIAEDTLVHLDKDMKVFDSEMEDEGEDMDVVYLDEEDSEDLEDFEYDEGEEEWNG